MAANVCTFNLLHDLHNASAHHQTSEVVGCYGSGHTTFPDDSSMVMVVASFVATLPDRSQLSAACCYITNYSGDHYQYK